MAAVLFRAFWPNGEVSPALGVFAIGFYVWLGLAMSGPLLLLRHRPATTRRRADAAASPRIPHERPSRTWAEMAWLLIGVYWFVMGVFVLPIRLHNFRFERHAPLRPGPAGRRPGLPAVRIESLPGAPPPPGLIRRPWPARHLADRLALPDRGGADDAVILWGRQWAVVKWGLVDRRLVAHRVSYHLHLLSTISRLEGHYVDEGHVALPPTARPAPPCRGVGRRRAWSSSR